MAHELRSTFFHGRQGLGEGLLVQRSSQAKADEVIRHAHASTLAHTPVERVSQLAREPSKRRRPVQRQPHKRNLELLRELDHDLEHTGNNVSVFMRIKMAWRNTSRDDAFDLGPQFGVNVQTSPDERGDNPARCLGERASGQQRGTLHKHQMTADIEAGCFAGKTHRVIECVPIRHECSRCENTLAMRVNDTRVDVTREAEIIGIDD